jgi:hypothetical protein
MLCVIYEDVEKSKSTICFLERDNVKRIEDFAENLLEAARFSNVSTRRSLNEIMRIFSNNSLSTMYSTNKIKNAADDVKRGRVTDIAKNLLEIAQVYLASQDGKSNKGKNGKILGSKEYIDNLAKNVFGDFVKSNNFPKGEKYGRMIECQIDWAVRRIKADITCDLDSGPKQMSANQHRIVRDAVKELEELNSRKIGPPIEVMLAGYRIMGSGIESTFPNMGAVEVNFFYVEFGGGFQANSDDLSATLGRFFKASIINAGAHTEIRENDYVVAGQNTADFLTGTLGAGVQHNGGFGLGAEARASVLSGSSTLVVEIGNWEIEVGVNGHVLSVGGTARVRITSSGIDIKKGASAIVGADISLGIRRK